ncbi:ABC transporter [Klebsiella grimontii]|uniref:ABC transporter n=1 Tax=Klebsiella grimontii TaxID=2058152 RepID=A0A7H4P5G4_9ENTR|nr:ABC transporter [Klebsiella grimontii]
MGRRASSPLSPVVHKRPTRRKIRRRCWLSPAAHPGSVTYPRPPDFTGTAFLEQLLLTLTPQPDALRQPPEEATFAAVTAPLWRYLDQLHPLLWRQGRDFPASPARMDAMLKSGTLRLSITFNPLHAQQKAGQRRAAERQLRLRLQRGDARQRPFCGDPGQCPVDGGSESSR